MRLNYLHFFALLSAVFLMGSCSKKNYDDRPIQSEWLLPLIKGDVSPLSLTTLNNRHFEYQIDGNAMGLAGTNSSSPIPLTFYNIGPYELETNDLIRSIHLDTCLVDMKVTNNFQVAIKAGTKVSIRSSGATSPFMTLTFPNDIVAGQSETFSLDLSNQTISNKLLITLDEFTVDAHSNQSFSENVTFDLHFKTVSIFEVEIANNQYYDLRDTVEFDGSDLEFDEKDQSITDSMINANILFTASNELPINMNFQIYFLDPTNNVIDSLFAPRANVDGAIYEGGSITEKTTSRFETNISKSRVEKIKGATQVVYGVSLDSYNYPNPFITVTRNQLLALKVIGDIKLVLSSSIF